ncbi:hypothetical protein Vretifemale_10223 [Volvox reticuliferus]|uniref:Uncharacterized protein n=1 Tax=Volvox reticuliferus TaxID=1737510 RepID=A0A8J4CE70_9CHLO|nr:hypothetical protein Vretifemale_10223 [Volvox reticuliferus]
MPSIEDAPEIKAHGLHSHCHLSRDARYTHAIRRERCRHDWQVGKGHDLEGLRPRRCCVSSRTKLPYRDGPADWKAHTEGIQDATIVGAMKAVLISYRKGGRRLETISDMSWSSQSLPYAGCHQEWKRQ